MGVLLSKISIDQDILTLMKDNNPSALELIWDHYANDLLTYLTSILKSRHNAEDVLQEVFITIARKSQLISKTQRFKSYLFKMTSNHAMDYIRKEKRKKSDANKKQQYTDLIGHSSSEEDEIIKEENEELINALKKISQEQRSIIMLKIFNDKTFHEIADFLNISDNTAASRYRYGLIKLKKFLKGFNHDK